MRTHLGSFQILEVVGRGGMGTVYRGLDPIIGRSVAVKVIRLLGYNDRDEQGWLRERLFSEARAAGKLCHPGIVTIYQVGEENEAAYIAMEFVDGPTLQQILQKEGRRPDPGTLCRILVEAAAALDYAHEHGLVHRDIKPANIMVSSTGMAKVTDFGIAKTMLGTTVTATGAMIGTPYYMSPEQVRGKTLDGRSDQFSLAVVAYEIFTGRKPFVAEQVTSICYQIIHEEPLSADDINPDVGPEIARVIRRGLAKDPDARYRNCTEFALALQNAVQARILQSTAPPLPAQTAPLPRAARRRFPRAAAVAAATTSVLLASAWAFTRSGTQRVGSPPSVVKTFEARTRAIPEPAADPEPVRFRDNSRPTKPREPVQASNLEKPAMIRTPQQVEEAIAPVREPFPIARRSMLVWTGQARRGDLITIAGNAASAGSVAGRCPEAPSSVSVYPAMWTGDRLTIFTTDARNADAAPKATPRGMGVFTFDPRHATDLTLFEAPDTQSRRLVIRVNAPLSAFVVECRP